MGIATRLFALALLLGATACDRSPAPTPTPTPAPVAIADSEPAADARGQGATLRRVKARGVLRCGVHQGLVGFAYTDNRGVWRGFDVDFCRAVSAAVFGRSDRVRFIPLTNETRFTALASGQVDLLARHTSVSFTRDTSLGVDFPAISYFDGQGFMAARSLSLTSATELGEARICIQRDATTEQNVADYFREESLAFEPVILTTQAEIRLGYQGEACDAIAGDISALASTRAVLNNPGAHVILPDVISKAPLGPVVRQGDDQWADVVRWTLNVLILAEEAGVTSRNVDDLRTTATAPDVRRLLGLEGGAGSMLGLSDDWAVQIIRAVGNYGEMFDRNLGQDSSLKLQRGLNALWSAPQPGLLYAPPLR